MSSRSRRSAHLILGALLAVSMWVTAPKGVAVAKPGEPFGTSLYLLEHTYGRTLLPLDPVTLADYSFMHGVTVGELSTVAPSIQPSIVESPNGSVLAFETTRCPACAAPHAKYYTIRLVDAHTGVQLGRFHPQVPLLIEYVADDGARIGGSAVQVSAQQIPTWYTLDGRSGRVASKAALPALSGSYIVDSARSRLYLEGTDGSRHLTLTAFDFTTGAQEGRVTLDDVTIGTWATGREVNGLPVQHVAYPGIAISPDGGHLAILDGDQNTLTTVDTPAMKVMSTWVVSEPRSLAERIGNLLGLLPQTADAKEIEGVFLQMRYSRDGRSLFVTGTRGAFDATGTIAFTPLGLQQIDAASGQIEATALDGEAIWWMGEAADGSALYTLTTEVRNDSGCPCVLQRLAPGSLQSTAHRIFDDSTTPRLFIIGGE